MTRFKKKTKTKILGESIVTDTPLALSLNMLILKKILGYFTVLKHDQFKEFLGYTRQDREDKLEFDHYKANSWRVIWPYWKLSNKGMQSNVRPCCFLGTIRAYM